MATNVVLSAIVPQVLTKYNYANWSDFVKDYLLGQDLWDIVETESKPKEDEAEFKTWRKKNAMALHAIKISCGPDMLSEIRKIPPYAKEVWDYLAKMYEEQVKAIPRDPEIELGYLRTENRDYDILQTYADIDLVTVEILSTGGTTLHTAVSAGIYWNPCKMEPEQDGLRQWTFKWTFNRCVKIVEELVQRMSNEDLEKQDSQNDTAFFLAVFGGITQMAECMHEKNNNLVSIAGRNGLLPVAMASIKGHKDMVRYLYNATPKEVLGPNIEGNINGATLISNCIAYEIFDVALHLVWEFPELAFARDYDGSSPVLILSQMPSAFRSGTRLVFWKWWIYKYCIRVPKVYDSNGDILIKIPKQHDKGQTDRGNIVIQVFGQLRGLLSKLFGIKQIYDFFYQLYHTKLIHEQADTLLWRMCRETSSLSGPQLEEGLVHKAILEAAKNGIVEFIGAIRWSNPNLLLSSIDEDSRNVFMRAIIYRQEEIFRYIINWLDATMVEALKSRVDRYGNNILHLAAMSAPTIWQGAALQMQKDLQWFQEVEGIVHPMFKEKLNYDGKTPHELLIENHKDLVKVGEEWKKETAGSCILVAALVITIMFAAIFTVPGGYNENTGLPLFSKKKWFIVFILSDAVSLFFSSTSLMTFLQILTSRLEENSLKSLPTKMAFGFATLLISIGTMAIAFCATLYLMLGRQWLWVYDSVIFLASVFVVVTLFILLKFPRTYRIPQKNERMNQAQQENKASA